MSNRVSKPNLRPRPRLAKTLRNIESEAALSLHTSIFGVVSSMPYTNCFRTGRPCTFSDRSKRCQACLDRKVLYDGDEFAGALVWSLE